MEKTFKQFFMECDSYPHSNACYELTKECAEFNLMAQFLESRKFMAEHAQVIQENADVFSGYFTESTATDTIEEIEQNFNEKGEGIVKTIKNGAKKLIEVVRNFFARIINSWDEDTNIINGVRAKLQKMQSWDAGKINSILTSAAKSAGLNADANQNFAKKIKVPGGESKDLRMDLLAVALSSDYVKLRVSIKNRAVDVDTLMKIFNAINGNKTDVDTAYNMLQQSTREAHEGGIEVNVNGKKLRGIIDRLKQLEEQVGKEAEQKQVDAIYANLADNPGKSGETANSMNKLYTALNGTVSATCSMYTSLNKFRHLAANELNTYASNVEIGNKAAGKDQ